MRESMLRPELKIFSLITIIKCFYNQFLRKMEITSDNEEFEDLGAEEYTEIPQSSIRAPRASQPARVFETELVELQNLPDLSILENQFYSLNLKENGELVMNNIRRRFSDFDIFFEILFRNYKGCIFPAFPEKGLLSYVKTKVTITKDTEYLMQRKHMLERFLSRLLNGGYFDMEKNEEIRKFLSQKQFDLMKMAEKQRSQGMIADSIKKIWGFVKMGRQNKYKSITDQLSEQKKDFQDLFNVCKEIHSLLQAEEQQCRSFMNEQFKFNKCGEYHSLLRKKQQQQAGNLYRIKQLQFELFCLNEDFVMVMKTIESIEEMKNNEENYRYLEAAETLFSSQYNAFQQQKKKELQKVYGEFKQLLQLIKKADESVEK